MRGAEILITTIARKVRDMAVSFTHETLGQRVHFGRGQVAKNLRTEALDAALGGDLPVALRWSEVRQHVPLENAEHATAGVDADER